VIAAIVLAAGVARRMGRQKLLLDLAGKPVLRWSVEAVAPHVGDLVVVTGPEARQVHDVLRDLPVRYVVNPTPEEGQGTSIAAGAAALTPATRAVIVVLGDQPRLPPTVIPTLVDAFRRSGAAIVAPVYRGVQGTPVLFAASTFPELVALTGDAGARGVVQARPERVMRIELDHPMPIDVDTPEDLAKLHVK
jgi:molybdenum cofactor cytidylyltransferase